jgi:hypothetical protein
MANTSRDTATPRDNSPSHRPTRNTGARYTFFFSFFLSFCRPDGDDDVHLCEMFLFFVVHIRIKKLAKFVNSS